MKVNSVKGTNDYSPQEARCRDYINNVILNCYTAQGFNRIYTPILEDIENLEHSDGGDNLALIFKVLKRGEKLDRAMESGDDLCDMGLRYDLTLPLCRFYAGHKNMLPSVFKVIQIDRVYRAERPQKGRNREFVQCDIDILGSSSPECEIELIDTTASALLALGMNNFSIAISDRSLLKKVLEWCGFDKESYDSVCISFDKLDKIGKENVLNELLNKGLSSAPVEKFGELLDKMPKTLDDLVSIIGEVEEMNSLRQIISSVEMVAGGKYGIHFDLSLVRGQGYYTGTIYEIRSAEYGTSLGGGGRYDHLVGKLCGEEVPAVGFSIGFERIYDLLKDKIDFSLDKKKIAILYEDGEFLDAMMLSKNLKENYNILLQPKANKLGKQLARLEAEGVDGYRFVASDIKLFER